MSSVVSLVYFVSISPQEKYIKGFQRIISDFTTIFPGFQIRLYVDDTVPVDSPILKMAATAHFVTVIKFDFGDQAPYVKAGARFLVFQDPSVHVAVTRDIDSLLTMLDAKLVTDFVNGKNKILRFEEHYPSEAMLRRLFKPKTKNFPFISFEKAFNGGNGGERPSSGSNGAHFLYRPPEDAVLAGGFAIKLDPSDKIMNYKEFIEKNPTICLDTDTRRGFDEIYLTQVFGNVVQVEVFACFMFRRQYRNGEWVRYIDVEASKGNIDVRKLPPLLGFTNDSFLPAATKKAGDNLESTKSTACTKKRRLDR